MLTINNLMRRMVRALAIILAAFLAVTAAGCKKKPVVNEVPLDQIDADDTNNYRYIFRNEIQKQQDESAKRKKNDFRR
jgi:hypothetical protein